MQVCVICTYEYSTEKKKTYSRWTAMQGRWPSRTRGEHSAMVVLRL
jgi:hypothetical protein